MLKKESSMKLNRQIIRSSLPLPILQALRRVKMKYGSPQYNRLTTQQVFTKVYEEKAWGKSDDPSQSFYSGNGSHDMIIVNTYVDAIRAFLSTFDNKPSVV